MSDPADRTTSAFNRLDSNTYQDLPLSSSPPRSIERQHTDSSIGTVSNRVPSKESVSGHSTKHSSFFHSRSKSSTIDFQTPPRRPHGPHFRAFSDSAPQSSSMGRRSPPPSDLTLGARSSATRPLASPGMDGATSPKSSPSIRSPTSPRPDNYKRYSGTVNHYGRHTNDWLFGGFSVRDTVRDGIDRVFHHEDKHRR